MKLVTITLENQHLDTESINNEQITNEKWNSLQIDIRKQLFPQAS